MTGLERTLRPVRMTAWGRERSDRISLDVFGR